MGKYQVATGTTVLSTFSWSNSLLIGQMIAYASNYGIPFGWLVCDGGYVQKSDYPQLYKFLTASGANPWGADSGNWFKLPDARAMFLRGADTNTTTAIRKADGSYYGGGNVGDFRADQIQQHTHDASIYNGHDDWNHGGEQNGWARGIDSLTPYNQAHYGAEELANPASGYSGNIYTGDETVPPHATVYYLIRAL